MAFLNYIKVEPTTFVAEYRRGEVRRKGPGLAFWYFAPTTTLVAVPLETIEVPFIFKELTQDFQEITVQGQLVYRVLDPEMLASAMNFTLKPNSREYMSDDPMKLNNRIINAVQVNMRTAIEALSLSDALVSAQSLVKIVKQVLSGSPVLTSLGVGIVELAIVAIKPTPETSRALEASVRERILGDADEAIYKRRNASIESERAIKENELRTELAVNRKQHEIQEAKLQSKRALQEQNQQIRQDEMNGDIAQEGRRNELVKLAVQNEREQADANAYELSAMMQALSTTNVKVLEAIVLSRLNPQQLVAQAFRELAENAGKIGQLNISPDLVQALAGEMNRG
jgi:hypothetical protein